MAQWWTLVTLTWSVQGRAHCHKGWFMSDRIGPELSSDWFFESLPFCLLSLSSLYCFHFYLFIFIWKTYFPFSDSVPQMFQGWTRWKPGARNSTGALICIARSQVLELGSLWPHRAHVCRKLEPGLASRHADAGADFPDIFNTEPKCWPLSKFLDRLFIFIY